MTAERRLRIGGWAALLVAIAAPIEVAIAVLSADRPGSLNGTAVSLVEIGRFSALLAAVIGLDPLFRPLAPDLAPRVGIIGILAAVALLVTNAVRLLGMDLAVGFDLLSLAGSVLIGIWFIGGGAILMREGGALARIGWSAELGGLGIILAAIAVAVSLSGPSGPGLTWLEWFRILGLFVIVYLVRIWLYVVRGRLPGPGIL